MSRRMGWRIALAVSVLARTVHALPAPRLVSDTVVTCAPSRPAVTPSDTVTLRVFGEPAIGRWATVRWHVTAGRLVGTGATVRWVLADAGIGRFTADVRVLRGGKAVGACTMEVVLVPPAGDMGGLLPAGALLVRDVPEGAGYGAYTYLLLGAPPADSAHSARYRAAIARYLQVAPDIANYDARLPRGRLNVNYLPVNVALPWRSDLSFADSVLAHYDYARAQVLLASFDGAHLGGPYLVTVPASLSTAAPIPGRVIFHDLSPITSDALVPAWVETYVTQATQQRWTEPTAWERFPLVLRTAIGSVALGIPQVKAAMKDWGGWLDSWAAVSKGKS